MNVRDLVGQINASFVKCPECEQMIDQWPEADESSPGDKVIYMARFGVFAGTCMIGHFSEFYLPEVKAGEIIPHMITERTLGRPVTQENCLHAKRGQFRIEPEQTMPTSEGLVKGPAVGIYCLFCMKKMNLTRMLDVEGEEVTGEDLEAV